MHFCLKASKQVNKSVIALWPGVNKVKNKTHKMSTVKLAAQIVQ